MYVASSSNAHSLQISDQSSSSLPYQQLMVGQLLDAYRNDGQRSIDSTPKIIKNMNIRRISDSSIKIGQNNQLMSSSIDETNFHFSPRVNNAAYMTGFDQHYYGDKQPLSV